MSLLPFKQVAIFEPSLCLPSTNLIQFDQSLADALDAWLKCATSRGADACYVRVEQTELGKEILFWMANRINVLAPALLFDPTLKVLAWHHKSNTKGLLPSGEYLQGISGHSIKDLQNSEGAGFDYSFLSPIFPSKTHPETNALGLKYLQESCKAFRIPIVALGGLNFRNGADCLTAGADGWAGIRCYL